MTINELISRLQSTTDLGRLAFNEAKAIFDRLTPEDAMAILDYARQPKGTGDGN